jgi:hypothetical protein
MVRVPSGTTNIGWNNLYDIRQYFMGGTSGSSGGGGGGGTGSSGSLFIDQAGGTADTYGVLSGARNSANQTFTTAQGVYASGTLLVYLNGQLLTQGSAEDWTETSPAAGTFSFAVAPESTDEITAVYSASGGGVASVTRLITWVIKNPTAEGIPGPRLKVPYTAVRVDSYVVGGTSVTFNIEERSTIGSAGPVVMGADMTADIDGETTTTFGNAGLAANNWLWLEIGGVTGAVTYLVVTLAVTG